MSGSLLPVQLVLGALCGFGPATPLLEHNGHLYLYEGGVLHEVDPATLTIVRSRTLIRGPGPWDNRLVVAHSQDGLRFVDTGVVVAEGGGVPDVLLQGDRLIAVFQYFPDEPETGFDKIAVAFSTDAGATWTRPETIRIDGLPATAARAPCDPDLVLLPDGRFRLYFTCDVHADRRGVARTLSATSGDAIHYTLDEGERFTDAPYPALDPSAIRIGDQWHLFVPRMAPGAPAHHLVSADGLLFELLGEVAVQGVEFRGNVVEAPGGFRFYGCGARGVSVAFSQDALTWRLEAAGPVAPVGDPAVVRLPGGDYLMVHMEPRRPRG